MFLVKLTDSSKYLLNELVKLFPSIEFIFYHSEHYLQRKESLLLRAGFGAKEIPFVVVYNDEKEPLKAFYSEVKECTIESISEYLTWLTETNQNY